MRRLEAADPIELKPTSFDEFDAAVSARTPSTPVVKLESSTKFGSSAKPSSPTQTTGVAPSASTGFGDFGAEVERRVRRSAPSEVPASSRPSSDAASARRSAPQTTPIRDAKTTQSAPRPSVTNAPKPAPKPADQPIFKPTPAAPVKPVPAPTPSAASKPATPRFDPMTGKPLTLAQNSPTAQSQQQRPSSAPAPRFDTKTGKPLAGSQGKPFDNPAVQQQKQKSSSATIPRFDPKTGKPLAAGQKASNDLYGGLSKEEFEKLHKATEAERNVRTTYSFSFEKLHKATEEPTQPKKKGPQIGCLPAIFIVGGAAALYQETGAIFAVIGIFIVNSVLNGLFGDKNANPEDKENS